MKTRLLVFATASIFAARAFAADKLSIAPPPSWVRPVALSVLPDTSGAAVNFLLQDQQVDLRAGHQIHYTENAFRIQTSQGLAAGNVRFSWNPEIDVATVHKLQVRRGDKVIDVLASGQTFTVLRRETNLENAALDGILTATIQPEGLQVGDIVDFAVSIDRADPALKNHIEEIGGGWNGLPVAHAHMRVQWPSSVHLHLRTAPGLPLLKPIQQNEITSVELSLDDLQPLQAPNGAPPRYAISRIWEITDFGSWANLAALMNPLYAKASTPLPHGAVQAEIARIAKQSADPKVRAEAALALVQERVRYVYLGLNDGGLVPADADTTWSRRFGDCKGKTALLLALLHGLGIKAEAVMVSVDNGDGLNQRLPLIRLFDHVLVRVDIAGKTYWTDGTRTGDGKLDQIRTPYFHWGLPIASGGELVAMIPPPPEQPLARTTVTIDATAGLSVPAAFHVEAIWRDDTAFTSNLRLANMSSGVRDKALRDYWRKQYNFVDVKSVDAFYDAAKREQRLIMDGSAHMDWSSGWYETDGLDVGYKADFTRDAGPAQDAPFLTDYPAYSHNEETILLPKGRNFTMDHGDDVDMTVAGVNYHRHTALVDNRFIGEATIRSVAAEFSAAEAPAAQQVLRSLANKTVYIKKPENYVSTSREADLAMLSNPSDRDGYYDRAKILFQNGRFDEAITDLTNVLALDPKNVWALASRGLAHAYKNEPNLAEADLDAAEKIDPKIAVIFYGRGILAANINQLQAAVEAFSKAIAVDPQDNFALQNRAFLYRALGDTDHAIADAGQVIKNEPHQISLYLLRANLYRKQGRRDLAADEAVALSTANPTSDYAQVTAGMIFAGAGKRTEAMQAFDHALAIAPSVYAYINRSRARARNDFEGRSADIDASMNIQPATATVAAVGTSMDVSYRGDPKSAMALRAKAELQDDRKDYTGAVATLTNLLEKKPADFDAILSRAIDNARLGNQTAANKDMAALSDLGKDAWILTKICRSATQAGVMLDRALDACNAAVGQSPNIEYLEDRALVLLRLDKAGEALAAFNLMLAREPIWPLALYGRGLAEKRMGQTREAKADMRNALKLDPDAKSAFENMGAASSQIH